MENHFKKAGAGIIGQALNALNASEMLQNDK